jgi:hypothetical protein
MDHLLLQPVRWLGAGDQPGPDTGASYGGCIQVAQSPHPAGLRPPAANIAWNGYLCSGNCAAIVN